MEKNLSFFQTQPVRSKFSAPHESKILEIKATDFLMQQHREIELLFEKLESEARNYDRAVMNELIAALKKHMKLEEDFFYPTVEEVATEEIRDATHEHEEIKSQLDLLAVNDMYEITQTELAELRQLVDHHFKEEEDEMFPCLEEELGREKLVELAYDMQNAAREN